MFGSETANNKTARGKYAEDRNNGWVSCYNLTDAGWQPVASRPFMAGMLHVDGLRLQGRAQSERLARCQQ